jgi:copper oxidase (laccase) domain-containing protein
MRGPDKRKRRRGPSDQYCKSGWHADGNRYPDGHAARGAQRGRLHAAIGPCIGPGSYEVGLEFLERFVEANPAYEGFFSPGVSAEKRMFDLPAFVLGRLAAAGVGLCEWVGRDTCAEPDQFFSNRRAVKRGQPDFGRLMSAIVLT